MSRRARPDGRAVWSPLKRFFVKLGRWCYSMTLGAFLTKHEDGTLTPSHTAILSTAFAIVMIRRLLPVANTNIFAPLGWPEAIIIFCVLFVKPINDAMNGLAKANPGKLVELLLARFGIGEVAQSQGAYGPANDGAPGGDLPG